MEMEPVVHQSLDAIDRDILRLLQDDGRLSNQDLARRIGLSPPATHARVRRLERSGVIARYAAILDAEASGFDLVGYVHVGLRGHGRVHVARFREVIAAVPEVQECHHVTGEHDYLLRVALHSRRDLERFLVDRLAPIPGVARIQTSLVIREVKRTTALPLAEPLAT